LGVSHRPLVFVFGLTVGDYLLWNWSLNHNLDAIALVAGLTLPPLAVACLWLGALSVARLLAMTASGRRAATQERRRANSRAADAVADDATESASAASSRKMAA
jgi:hypothetical protein